MSVRRTSDEITKARSDLAGILRERVKETETIVELIENELKGLKSPGGIAKISSVLSKIADATGVDSDARDNLLYWLTESSSDVRQMILVQTIEELLRDDTVREDMLKVLVRLSSEESVSMVLDWVERGILTLGQGVYVLLYPNATDIFR